jgi:hypothetical protein
MLSDTIVTGTTAVTYTRRSPKGTRSVFVPTGDIPSNERRIEVAHEVTAAKRVNSMVKVALNLANVNLIVEECSATVKIAHPASFTEAQVQLLVDHLVKFLTAGNVTKLFNQEQ